MDITDITQDANATCAFAPPHELVLRGVDRDSGYWGIIAIHSTARGIALGGTRIWHYATEATALADALRLSHAMTLKNALAGLPFGGGKAVVLAPALGARRDALLRAHGLFVDSVGGRYITAEDVGTSVDDMEIIATQTEWVAGRRGTTGDPSPHTALGVVRAIEAAALVRLGVGSLERVRVGIQGLGNVGIHVARLLIDRGARVVGTDLSPDRLRLARAHGVVTITRPDDIYGANIDVFCPCALGGTLNDDTVPRLEARIVAGAANSQLWTEETAATLADRGILYVPDFVANAGGVIGGSAIVMGWSSAETRARVEAIFDTTLDVLQCAELDGVTPDAAARAKVRSILASAE